MKPRRNWSNFIYDIYVNPYKYVCSCIQIHHIEFFNICTYTNFSIYVIHLYLHISRWCMYVIIIYHHTGNIYGSITCDKGAYRHIFTFPYGMPYYCSINDQLSINKAISYNS